MRVTIDMKCVALDTVLMFFAFTFVSIRGVPLVFVVFMLFAFINSVTQKAQGKNLPLLLDKRVTPHTAYPYSLAKVTTQKKKNPYGYHINSQ